MHRIGFSRPSARFAFAFQLALALVIGSWLALSFDWERPRWVAFAIVAIAVPHMGMSLSRAAERLLGTFVGCAVALLIVALFPQDRWLFILGLSSWMALCTYLMCFSERSYFWHCAGFIASIIAATTANVGGNSFMLAIDRTLETSLGIVVYTAVALLVWRQNEPDLPPPTIVGPLFFPDRDAVVAAARVFIIYWLSFLAIVYVPDFPTGLSFLAPMGAFAMAIAVTPQLPIKALYLPVALGLLIASFLYMLVLPILSGYVALGVLLFVIALAVGYRYYAPQETLMRVLVLVIFAAITGINNDQAYTFAAVSNNLLTFTWILIMLHVSTLLPVRIQPETKFLRLLDRFRNSVAWLQTDPPPTSWWSRWLTACHRHEILTIPNKLAIWQPRLSPALVAPVSGEIEALMQRVKDIRHALQDGAATAGDTRSTIADLDQHCARIDWSPWWQPKF
jgi:hypothetical protein